MEQTINRRGKKGVGGVLVACLVLFLGACMPSGEENINAGLFKDKEELKQKTAQLKPGMKQAEVFKTLGLKPEQCDRMSTEEVQMSLYGNSQVTGTPEQLEKFRERISSYEGYALPYREIRSDSSLGFGKMKVHKHGSDLRLVLIFERNKLLRASVEGTEEVSQREDQYLWGTLIRRGLGLAF